MIDGNLYVNQYCFCFRGRYMLVALLHLPLHKHLNQRHCHKVMNIFFFWGLKKDFIYNKRRWLIR